MLLPGKSNDNLVMFLHSLESAIQRAQDYDLSTSVL